MFVKLTLTEGKMSYSEDDVLSNYRKEYAECSRYYLDERDGVRYKVMIIGNQAWLAENLRYKHVESFSFDNDEENDVLYGRYYKHSVLNEVCPEGFRIPGISDFVKLYAEFGSVKWLQKEKAWPIDGKETNISGLSFFPAGAYDDNGKFFYADGDVAYFWTFEKSYNDCAYIWQFGNNSQCFSKTTIDGSCHSVRCVMDLDD